MATRLTRTERRRHQALRDDSALDLNAERAGHVARSLARRQAQLIVTHGPVMPTPGPDALTRVIEVDLTDQITDLFSRRLAGAR